jgi:predicted outer membrane repeat protein
MFGFHLRQPRSALSFQRRNFRPRLETLEARCAPAVLNVITNADSGPGSLRAIIGAANTGDTINFTIHDTTITLSSEISISNATTIDGTTKNITISGNNHNRIFNISIPAATTETLKNLIFTNGSSGNNGGAIVQSAGTLSLTNDKFNSNNSSANGGAVSTAGGLGMNNDSFTSNTATLNGGAVYAAGGTAISISATDCVFTSNTASINDGGAIYTEKSLTVSGGTFTNNLAGTGGGAIEYHPPGTSNSQMTLTNVTFTTNTAELGGGVLSDPAVSQGTTTISVSGCLFNANKATGSGAGGGGMEVAAVASGSGSASLTITNSTFYKNMSDNAGGGLAILNSLTGSGTNTSSLTSLTIYQNTAALTGVGGGLDIATTGTGTTPKVHNSIIAGNTGPVNDNGPDVYGTVNSQGYNLIGEGGTATVTRDGNKGWVASDYVGTDANPKSAGLDPNGLADNGGPTETIKLLSTSQGYRNGDVGTLLGTQDQRGLTRTTYVSIGAYDPDAS